MKLLAAFLFSLALALAQPSTAVVQLSVMGATGPTGPAGATGPSGANGATGPTGAVGGMGTSTLQSGAVTGNCGTDSNQTYYWTTASGASYAIPTSPTTGCTVILQDNDGSNALAVTNASAQTINGQTGALSIAACGTPTTGCPTKRLSWDAVHSVWILGNPNGAAGATGATGATGPGGGNFALIQDQTLGSGAATVTFSAIPGTYKHLKLFVNGQSALSSFNDTVWVQANGDTAAHYTVQVIAATNTSVTGIQAVSAAQPLVAAVSAASAGSLPGSFEMTFPGYASTVFQKSGFIGSNYLSAGTNAETISSSWVWNNGTTPVALTSLTIGTTSGSNFITGSEFTLYGIN